jgi:hypothetical protein
MKLLACSSLVCAGLALSSSAYSAQGIAIFEISIGTCHFSNLVRNFINRIFLSGPTKAHQALASLPEDFSDIAARTAPSPTPSILYSHHPEIIGP